MVTAIEPGSPSCSGTDKLHDNDKAIADYTKSIELDPTFSAAYVGRGRCWADKGDYQRASTDY